MEQIIIQIRDKQKIRLLVELLGALDFVDSVEVIESPVEHDRPNGHTEDDDFFALAGIWQDRDINQDTLRHKAWPQQEQ